MTVYASLPTPVLAKIASLDAGCLTLRAALDHACSELRRLQQQQRELLPRTVHDEYEANREAERLALERQRLTDVVDAQTERCDQLQRRLRAEERIVAACKRFLHELPVTARLRAVEPQQTGDLDDIRKRIGQVRDEISRLQSLAVPAHDIADRVRAYVGALAASAQPVIQGIGDGQALSVFYPLHDHADRVTLTGFARGEGSNPLLLLALVDPERLSAALLRTITANGLSATERDARLRALQAELVDLRYAEETAICAALDRGDIAVRSTAAPAWAVLMVEVEHDQEAAA